MGFPVGYTEVFLPKVLIHALSFLGYIRSAVLMVFSLLGLSDFIESGDGYYYYSDDPNSTPSPTRCFPAGPPVFAVLIRELLPVIKFSEAVECSGGAAAAESCAVCLYEFEGGEEIRWLKNCKHIFHQSCVDRWMDHDQKTCPLCRTPFVPRGMEEEFNQRLWAASPSYHSVPAAQDYYFDDYDDHHNLHPNHPSTVVSTL